MSWPWNEPSWRGSRGRRAPRAASFFWMAPTPPERSTCRSPRPAAKWRRSGTPPQHVWFESKKLGNTGYVRFNMFLDLVRVMPSFGNAVEACKTCDGMIIDLRGNPGGIGEDGHGPCGVDRAGSGSGAGLSTASASSREEPDDVEVEPVLGGQLEADQQGRAERGHLHQLLRRGRNASATASGPVPARMPVRRSSSRRLAPDAERGVAAGLVAEGPVVEGRQADVEQGLRHDEAARRR